MPVCITGMHRSGTSMVANLLNLCGVYLGEEGDLMPPTNDNLNGYWENRKFSHLNDQILAKLGGTWDMPPPATAGWVEQEALTPLRAKAEMLMEDFHGREPWGWKDPRNSLTLPFWDEVVKMRFLLGLGSRLKLVICLRNPLEVFRSLRDREHAPSAEGRHLWVKYSESALNSSLPEDRIVTHYESYFRDPRAELRRVLEFLKIPVSTDLIDRSISAISSSLRHQRLNEAVSEQTLDRKLVTLYRDLCREANFIELSEN